MAPRTTRRSNRTAKLKKEAEQEDSRENSETPDNSNGINTPSSAKSRESVEKSTKDEEEVSESIAEEEEGDNDEEEEDSSDEEDVPVPKLMVNERSRRATAGNKMATLLASADHEDEFYKTAYGGFEENEVDKEFASPVHSDEDDVDSDFDREEDEDEPVSGDENGEEKRERRRRKFKEPKRGLTADDILAKNKKWAMARLAGNVVEANAVDDRTQANMLKEAEKTEKLNIESLKKYEAFELEKKKRRERASVRVFPPGPRQQIKMTKEGTTVTISEIKTFECGRPKVRNVCAVTGRPARYFDPVTKLPYSTAFAFKVIRDKYNKYLRTIEGNEEVTAYLNRLKKMPTPPPDMVASSKKPSKV